MFKTWLQQMGWSKPDAEKPFRLSAPPPSAKLDAFFEGLGFHADGDWVSGPFRTIQYNCEDIKVTVYIEPNTRYLTIKYINNKDHEYYTDIWKDFIFGPTEERLSFEEAVDFIIENWSEIVRLLHGEFESETQKKLRKLSLIRARRNFPTLTFED